MVKQGDNKVWLQEMRKGFLSMAILRVISSGPHHGYGIIKGIYEMTGFQWNPSPGSVYPALSGLEKLGYISPVSTSGEGDKRRKVYAITAKGEEALKQARLELDMLRREFNSIFDYNLLDNTQGMNKGMNKKTG
ncbi:MAG: PadR family transcriptional regulator [Methermicoccaceae archaeon]